MAKNNFLAGVTFNNTYFEEHQRAAASERELIPNSRILKREIGSHLKEIV